MAKKSVKSTDLGAVIRQELTLYAKEVQERVDAAGNKAIKKLVKRTQLTAPMGNRMGGNFATSIASKKIKGVGGSTYVWYVKEPNYRLTHLLVHGHATRDGDRTDPNPFLENALDEILPEYEAAVEEAIKNDK